MIFISGLCLFALATGLAAVAPERSLRYTYLLMFVGAVFAGAGSVLAVYAPPTAICVSSIIEYIPVSFAAGPLSGFFGLVLSAIAAPVSLYSAGYCPQGRTKAVLYGLFVLSLYALFYSADAVSFIIAWEAMSIFSYFLVISHTEDQESGRAGLVYSVMTHAGTALILAAFFAAYAVTGRFDFDGMRVGLAGSPEWIRSVIFCLSFLGFGMKAAIIPLHLWLPRAHPAAPSNVSALMSGIMVKAGIYGMLLMGFYVLGANVAWWGMVILVTGIICSVLGVLYVLMEHDIKRLLAYSSVENIGIILLGMGASALFASAGMRALAGLALAAAMFHVLNHAMFKGLLFMGAGAVHKATHTRNMEEMGGLLKRMPYTGLFFLIGCVSISALPPFNGFSSEWLTFQSLILGSQTPRIYMELATLLGGAALALTGGLAAASFIKAFGIPFLGQPRSAKAENADESNRPMILAMGIAAAACLALGLFPSGVLGLISKIPLSGLDQVSKAGMYPGMTTRALLSPVNVAGGFAQIQPAGILAFMLAGLAALLVFLKIFWRRPKTVYRDSWDCGMQALTPRMQYTATAFSKPVRVVFKNIYMPKKEVSTVYTLKPFFVSSMAYKSQIRPFFEEFLYRPALKAFDKLAMSAKRLQSGSLQLYLGYMLLTLLAMLVLWA